ncbi:MAG TPA: TIM barrel protein [Sphingobium sp.]
MAADPARVVEFRAGVDRALDYAAALDCQKLHIMPGKIPKDDDRTRWSDTFLDNIRFAADRAGAGISLMLEAINTRVDMPASLERIRHMLKTGKPLRN